ncbi:DNA-binding protein [Ruminococcus sp. OM08-7]|nr:DNA-binding protein [Ruminococcus sp. OM08-7]
MGKSLLDIAVDKLYDALGGDKLTGKLGELYTAKELKYVQLFGRKGRILRNVYVPKDNGETSEIDLLYITQKGIFVFESKNYSGWIFGDEKGQKWTMMLPNKEKHSFYNPVKQNQTHIKWLRNYIGENIPLFSIIVFSERCELKKITIVSQDVKVIKRDLTYAAVRDIWDKNEDRLSGEEVENLYIKLRNLTKVSKETKENHIQNIKDKYGDSGKKSERQEEPVKTPENVVLEPEKNIIKEVEAEEPNIEKAETDKICPRCGKKMVLRTAKKGENAGKQFWGCSGFPKCRYIES